MLILSDVSENVSQSATTNFTVDVTSIVLSVLSVIICSAALIVAIVVARRDARNRFEAVVEECLAPIAIFIQDIFVIRSDEKFRDLSYVKEGDNKLVEGLHRLRVFAITNGYTFLEEATRIRGKAVKNGTVNNDDHNEKIFSYCLLKLEYNYMEFRKEHDNGIPNEPEMIILAGYSVLFQEYLKIISKNMFNFMNKKRFKNVDNYFNELKKVHTEGQELCSRQQKTLTKKPQKKQTRKREAKK